MQELAHAGLWLQVRLSDPPVVRRGHLHAVWGAGGGWRLVDLARQPLRTVPERVQRGLPVEELTSLRQWLGSWQLLVYVLPELEAVSAVGEPADAFRTRFLGVLGPGLRSGEIPRSGAAAGSLARVAGAVREVACGPALSSVRQAEIGPLLVPSGMRLPPSPAPCRAS